MHPERCWLCFPQEWQHLTQQWAQESPNLLCRSWQQWTGDFVLALSVGNPAASVRLLITVPHAHEPAGTAVCVDAIHQVLFGTHLDGTPTDSPITDLKKRLFVTFVPDSNPQGRKRSPERVWDGTKYDNETFLKIAFGIATDGTRFGRYPEWRFSEHQPKQVGIIYEQIRDDLWVEPNTSRQSTHSKALDDLLTADRYTHYLELHQHETDEAVLLPAWFEELSAAEQGRTMEWANAVFEAWRQQGIPFQPSPYIPYRGQQRQQFFRCFWEGRRNGLLNLTVEVRNNRHAKTEIPTPLSHQFFAMHAAVTSTLLWLLQQNAD